MQTKKRWRRIFSVLFIALSSFFRLPVPFLRSFPTFSFLGFSVFLPVSLFLSSSVSSFVFLGPRACGVIFCSVYVYFLSFVLSGYAFCYHFHNLSVFWLFAPLRIVFVVLLVCVTCTLLSHLGFVYANFRSARTGSLCYRCFRICLLICFACCSCHRGFADAYCFVLHAALAIGALQMLIDLCCMLLLPSGL